MEKNCGNCENLCTGKCPVSGFEGKRENFYCSRHQFKKEKKIYKADVWVIWNDHFKEIHSTIKLNGSSWLLGTNDKLIKKIPIECEYEEPTNL